MHIQWPRCDPVRSLFCVISPDLSVSLLRYDLHVHPFLCVRECGCGHSVVKPKNPPTALTFQLFPVVRGEGSQSCRAMLWSLIFLDLQIRFFTAVKSSFEDQSGGEIWLIACTCSQAFVTCSSLTQQWLFGGRDIFRFTFRFPYSQFGRSGSSWLKYLRFIYLFIFILLTFCFLPHCLLLDF